MKSISKVSITAIIAVIAVASILAGIGAFVSHNNYTPSSVPLEKASVQESAVATVSSNSGPPGDKAAVTDSVALQKNTNLILPEGYTTQALINEEASQYLHEHPEYRAVVTKVFRHADGTVFAAFTDHNTRTVQGINCAEQLLFATAAQGVVNTNGTNVCTGLIINTSTTHFNGYNTIFLVNGTVAGHAMVANGSDTITTSKIGGSRASSAAGIEVTATANEGGPASCTVAGTATYNQITCTSGTYAFTNLSPGGTAIRGVFLGNSTSSTATSMFAENAFTAVPVANTDTLTVTWTISLT